MLEKFLEYLKFKGYSNETIKTYRYFLANKVNDILQNNIDSGWFSKNPFTRASQIAMINSFIRFLNSSQGFNLKEIDIKVKTPRKVVNPPDYKTLSNFIASLKEDTFQQVRKKMMLTLLLESGIRTSELRGINLEDIKENEIVIRGKGGKERLVYLRSVELLEKYLTLRKGIAKCNALFVSMRGYRISRTEIYEEVKDVLTSLGYEVKRGPHQLRHAFATYLAKNGVNVFVLQKILGHSSLSSTMKYVNITNEDVKYALSLIK